MVRDPALSLDNKRQGLLLVSRSKVSREDAMYDLEDLTLEGMCIFAHLHYTLADLRCGQAPQIAHPYP